VILLEIYPAREEPIEGISSKWLLDKIANENKKIVTKEDLSIEVKNSKCKIKLMVGAGDIGVEVESITKYLKDED
jgi:UDP-N-acetylmuramate--alanine ligase